MIRFKCPDCAAGLRVDDAKAGKRIAWPRCGKTVRAPARSPSQPEIVEELPVVEDEDEEEEEVLDAVAADDDDRPRKRRRKIVNEPPPEEEAGDREFVTRNRIMGLIGILFGVGFLSSALIIALVGVVDLRNPLNSPYNCGGCLGVLFGMLLIGVGALYLIRG